jgi:HD-GYP domain-containing protein (c-di-GMP phosphodiesterase class II)
MLDESNVFIKKFIFALSGALGLLSQRISKHHQRVTHICLNLANKVKLKHTDKTTLFYSALLHDIGAFSSQDKLDIMNFEYINYQPHCEAGFQLLNKVEILREAATIVRYHHDNWDGVNNSGLNKDAIPLLSQIIHLADRIEVLINDQEEILAQNKRITKRIVSLSSIWFNPILVETFQKIASRKIFWVGLMPEFVDTIVNEFAPEDERKITIETMIEIAHVFAQVVDYKSHHSRTHCSRVTEIALKLGRGLGLSKSKLQKLWISALLHDLGKLSIPDEILDKPASLTYNEYNIIKMHPYFTYRILIAIPGFDEVAQWAFFHHEQINGGGYPLGVDADNIPLGARIITVADQFSALTEDRPYRHKLSSDEAIKIMEENARWQMIDKKILDILKQIITNKK